MILALILTAQLAAADKPVIVLTRSAECAPCDRFEQSVKHPAMQRRLASVELRTVVLPELAAPSLAVQDPAGREGMRWTTVPTWLVLADVLSLVESAAPHLMRAYHAGDDAAVAEREWALAVLALGAKERGRALLESMRTSPSPENRELAAVWLERLGAMREKVLAAHARQGSTERVRFEAFMALGDARMTSGSYERAVEAFDDAVKLTADKSLARRNALTARQNAAEMISPVVGLGAPDAVVTGRKTLQPRNLGRNVSRVEFRLDGKTVATSRRRPFSAGVTFARIPARQVLEVIARDPAGKVVSRSSVVVNERSEAFDVDFIEPRFPVLSGAVDVDVAARVPRGRSVEQLTIEWNGAQVARFTAPPYRTRVNVPNGEQGILRAVLRLDDGSETEDVLLANSAGVLESRAHLIEVPAYFDAPVSAGDVTVREGGTARTVERVIPPAEAPLLIALVIDSSESMIPHMLDVQEAAVRFVEEHIQPRDRTMVVGFTSNVRVLLRPSPDRAQVARSILSLRPKGGTALYDAIVKTLLQLQSPESRKAMVVFSDGLDGGSVLEAEDVAEVARRAGVPIYVLSFGEEDRTLETLSTRSGGKWFPMPSLDQLTAHWGEIAADLRKQSLVIYRTDPAGAEWRTLSIEVNGRGAVRAPSGVYVTADR